MPDVHAKPKTSAHAKPKPSPYHARMTMPFRGAIRALRLDAVEAALVLIVATAVAAVASAHGLAFMQQASVLERLMLLGAFAAVAFRAAFASLERSPRPARAAHRWK